VFDPEPYFVNVSPEYAGALLADWEWLLGGRRFEVFRVTAMGDLFLRDDRGRIHFLDMVGGKLVSHPTWIDG
jgi:hypothetical protein